MVTAWNRTKHWEENQTSSAEMASTICTNTIQVLVVNFSLYTPKINSLCAQYILDYWHCRGWQDPRTWEWWTWHQNRKAVACPKLESPSEKDASFAPSRTQLMKWPYIIWNITKYFRTCRRKYKNSQVLTETNNLDNTIKYQENKDDIALHKFLHIKSQFKRTLKLARIAQVSQAKLHQGKAKENALNCSELQHSFLDWSCTHTVG